MELELTYGIKAVFNRIGVFESVFLNNSLPTQSGDQLGINPKHRLGMREFYNVQEVYDVVCNDNKQNIDDLLSELNDNGEHTIEHTSNNILFSLETEVGSARNLNIIHSKVVNNSTQTKFPSYKTCENSYKRLKKIVDKTVLSTKHVRFILGYKHDEKFFQTCKLMKTLNSENAEISDRMGYTLVAETLRNYISTRKNGKYLSNEKVLERLSLGHTESTTTQIKLKESQNGHLHMEQIKAILNKTDNYVFKFLEFHNIPFIDNQCDSEALKDAIIGISTPKIHSKNSQKSSAMLQRMDMSIHEAHQLIIAHQRALKGKV